MEGLGQSSVDEDEWRDTKQANEGRRQKDRQWTSKGGRMDQRIASRPIEEDGEMMSR